MGTFLVFCCAIFLLSDLSSAQSQCKTPNKKNGICVSIQECSALYNIFRSYSTATKDEQSLLVRSFCDNSKYPAWVCCESEIVEQRSVDEKFAKFPTPGECGTDAGNRIVGGQNAHITQFRWLAQIEYKTRNGLKRHKCGGSLIHKNYILTAAHCLNDTQLKKEGWTPFMVRLGEHDTGNNPDCYTSSYGSNVCADPFVDVPIDELIIHEGYEANSTSHFNDIALIRLAYPVNFTNWIKPLCLPVAPQLMNITFDAQQLYAAGFGISNLTRLSNINPIKQWVGLLGVNWERCNDIFVEKFREELIDTQLCAGGEKGKDTCAGDSGGPIMGIHKADPYSLPYYYSAGIVSRGSRVCGTQGLPSLYTRTDQFLDWINEKVV